MVRKRQEEQETIMTIDTTFTKKSKPAASAKNIVRIPNFLDEHELKLVTDYCENLPQEHRGTERVIIQVDNGTPLREFSLAYTQRIAEKVSKHFGLSVTDLSGTTLRVWHPGEEQAPHSDCEAIFYVDSETGKVSMTEINNFSSIFIEYAALTYINTDYEGGEIYFPDHDIEIRPSAGDAIFFPGTEMYMHGVRKITSGKRIALMTFFTTPKIKYIWKTFVADQSPLQIISRNEHESMNTKGVFTRKNMPINVLEYFK